ncbi:MAG: hypothetical protein ACQES2_11790 [Pseudomonadota bacterium]
MELHKSYKLIRFLNRSHSPLLCRGYAAAAWLGAMAITRSPLLARHLADEFARGDFRLSFRRAGWYARHFSPALDWFDDPFFDFTMGTGPDERRAMAAFLRRQANKQHPAVALSDQLYLQAADIHAELEYHVNGSVEDLIEHYYDTADTLLSRLPRGPVQSTSAKVERTPDFSLEDARLALSDFAEALPLDEWPWYVVSGTFLGLWREGGFLGHDYDIDVGINAEDIDIDAMLEQLQRQQPTFVVKKVDSHVEVRRAEGGLTLVRQPALVKLIHENGLNLDVFIHYTEGGVCWHGSEIHCWENTPFGLTRDTLEGVAVNRPDNPDQYLTENYGDWKTPVKEFDCTTGTPNLVVSRNFLSVALFLKRLAFFSLNAPQQAKKLSAALVQEGVIISKADSYQYCIYRRFSPNKVNHYA